MGSETLQSVSWHKQLLFLDWSSEPLVLNNRRNKNVISFNIAVLQIKTIGLIFQYRARVVGMQKGTHNMEVKRNKGTLPNYARTRIPTLSNSQIFFTSRGEGGHKRKQGLVYLLLTFCSSEELTILRFRNMANWSFCHVTHTVWRQ